MKKNVTPAFLVALIGGGVLSFGASRATAAEAKPASLPAAAKSAPSLPPAFLELVREKRTLEERIAQKHGLTVPSRVWDFFTAAGNGDWPATSNLFQILLAELRPPSGEPSLPKPLWGAINDTFGVCEKIAEWSPELLHLYSSSIAKSIPPGSIYFGGNDAGRFGPILHSASHSEGRPFFTLSQNGLADEAYLGYLRHMYGEKINIPSTNDAQQCISQYTEDAGRRLAHDQKFPQESRQIRPGETVRIVNGNITVDGHVALMGMNALLAKAIFDQNPRHEFYYTESFPLEWLNPYLIPHQFIFKVSRDPLAELSPATVRADREFWSRQGDTWLGAWLSTNTPVDKVTNFVSRIFLEEEREQFKGDLQFIQDDKARRFFSKVRSSIGGVYAWRAAAAKDPEERQRMMTEADFAFQQAYAFAPESPEALFRYVNLLISDGRVDDALRVARVSQALDPSNAQMNGLISELRRINRMKN